MRYVISKCCAAKNVENANEKEAEEYMEEEGKVRRGEGGGFAETEKRWKTRKEDGHEEDEEEEK